MNESMNCCMCGLKFEREELDFLGRCLECFEKYKNLPNDEKPNLGIPSMPSHKSLWKK